MEVKSRRSCETLVLSFGYGTACPTICICKFAVMSKGCYFVQERVRNLGPLGASCLLVQKGGLLVDTYLTASKVSCLNDQRQPEHITSISLSTPIDFPTASTIFAVYSKSEVMRLFLPMIAATFEYISHPASWYKIHQKRMSAMVKFMGHCEVVMNLKYCQSAKIPLGLRRGGKKNRRRPPVVK